jgi:probable rRNA maturation factor
MSLYQISIANRQRAVRIDRRAITALARATLAREQVAAAEISVAFVDDAEIHEINLAYLNHDFPTDVISFRLDGNEHHGQAGARGTIRRGAGQTIDGEIVISADTAARTATELSTTTEHEMGLYLVHGLLHLCGYDDLTAREKRLMRRREAEALHAAGRASGFRTRKRKSQKKRGRSA